MNKKIITFLLLLFAFAGLPIITHAAACVGGLKGGIDCIKNEVLPTSGLVNKTFTDVLATIILWLMGTAAVIALAAIVWGGISYILSLGDERKTETAKHVILYAVIGLLIIGASFVIISVVKTILT